MINEFMEFLKQYNVLGLAVAVIIGGKLNTLVSSLINNLLAPLIFNPLLTTLGVKSIEELSWKGIFYGKVVATAIDFLVVALVVFLMIRWTNRLAQHANKLAQKKEKAS